MHAPVAMQFLKRGIHVICDKPLTATLAEAKKLAKAAEASGVVFALTHNYTGYPMIRQAKAMVAGGELGEIRLVNVEYVQDWLTEAVEASGQKQADWRTDPARSGAGGSTGDIGTHAFNLANFVSGLTLDTLAADLTAFVPGRRVDDNGHVLMRFQGGAKGMLWCSQVAPGNENALRLRVYGTKGGLEWAQEDPNQLWFTPFGQPKRLITRGGAGSGPEAARMTRVPPGHPEGYLEGFANIYAEAARAIRAAKDGTPVPEGTTFPGLKEGLEGVAFVDACVRSSARNGAWVSLNLLGLAAEREGRQVSLRPVSMVDGVYDNIYERLMSLEIAPGARIAIDVLARDLDISQTPVREALSRLEREGWCARRI
jgi:predicted dehydrogenase